MKNEKIKSTLREAPTKTPNTPPQTAKQHRDRAMELWPENRVLGAARLNAAADEAFPRSAQYVPGGAE